MLREGAQSMYAIVETGGKQYKVAKGDILQVEKIDGTAGDTLELDKILLIKDDDGLTVGRPLVDGAKVVGRIRAQGRGTKIVVFKYKRRKNCRRKQGHRQDHTWIAIEDIITQGGTNGSQEGRRKLTKRQGQRGQTTGDKKVRRSASQSRKHPD